MTDTGYDTGMESNWKEYYRVDRKKRTVRPRLEAADVRKIRELGSRGFGYSEIQRITGVHKQSVKEILLGNTYKWVK